jgi:hypothetical protein
MVSQPILEGMLGLESNAVEHKVSLSPSLPAHWDSFNVNNIKIGDHDLDFEMKRIEGTTTYQFAHSGRRRLLLSFAPFLPPGTEIHNVKLNGGELKPKIDYNSRHTQLIINLELRKSSILEIEHSGSIDVIPLVSNPKPGYKSNGFRFLSADFRGKEFIIELQGRSGSNEVIELYISDREIDHIENAMMIERKDNLHRLAISFALSKKKYVNKTVKVLLK